MPIATACSNIALVKYWGKRDHVLNLPETGSLSLTLEALTTETRVDLLPPEAGGDELILGGEPETGRALERASRFLELVRADAVPALRSRRARIESKSSFPIASGLASSASGFAALAVAGAAAYRLDLDPPALSRLARRGSGSAARSIFGGLVEMQAGSGADGTDAYARPLPEAPLVLHAAIAVVRAKKKAVGSSEGMERTRTTSPYHARWVEQVARDFEGARRALGRGDFAALAEVVEGSCLAMHADAMAARPGIIYLSGASLWAIERVRALRAAGTPAMFTIDAGPHVVAFTLPEHLEAVAAALAEHPEVERVIRSKPGPGAQLVDAGARR